MPHADPQKRKEYNDNYRKSQHGRERILAGKRAAAERIKSDPEKLAERRRKHAAYMRVRILSPEQREKQNAKWRERYRASHPRRERKTKPQREPMKPLELDKSIWKSARHGSMFIENRKTVKRGRKKQKKELPQCDHNQGFKFKMTDVGMRRTCNGCGRSFTEVAKR